MKRRSRKDRTDAPRAKRWGFRVGAAISVPVIALILLEVGLRLLGVGFSTGFFIQHPEVTPQVLVENQRFPRRFFPPTLARFPQPILFHAQKASGAVRIFVFGESAAMGDPAPAFSFARILGVLLQTRYPDTEIEVVNTAFTAINSHVIRAIARDCRPREGDAWLLYLGHNEVIGPFGTGTIFGHQSPPLGVIRASLALKSTRLGQLLDGAFLTLAGTGLETNGWAGMDMFLEQQVRASDPRLRRLEAHFERNLDDIIRFGVASGAQVVVSTAASRLRDWPPFGSLHRADLTPAEQARWTELVNAGVKDEAAGNHAGALEDYDAASRVDDEFAELHYRQGRCCLALGKDAEARQHLERARDLDALRFRTDTRLNARIRESVEALKEPRVRLLDAEARFASVSPRGIPGEEWFLEHVHLTFAGNYRLARWFAEELASILAPRLGNPSASSPDWLDEAECAARLGYTENQQYEVGVLLRRRFGEAIYRAQLGYAERYEALQQRLAALRLQTKPTARRQALRICREAIARNPDDWALHDLTARLLLALGDLDEATVEWQRVAGLIPHWAVAYTELGKLARTRGDFASARSWFVKAAEVNPDYADAYAGLGTILIEQGRTQEARRQFRKALRLDPTCEEAGLGLARLGANPVP